MRWRERRPGDPGVEADVADLGEWGPELLALRAEPRPEFLARLDRRMQPEFSRGRADEQLAAQRPRGRLGLLPALGIAVPPAAAAVVAAVLIAGSGGSSRQAKLPVAVQAQPGPNRARGAAAPDSESALSRPVGPPSRDRHRLAPGGRGAAVRPALLGAASRLGVREPLADRRGSATSTRRVDLPAGSGRLRIATDELRGGRYALVVALPSGQSALRARVRILD